MNTCDLLHSNFAQVGWTALIWACQYGHTVIARMLIDHGATVDHCDKVKDLEHVTSCALYLIHHLLRIGVWGISSYGGKSWWSH